MSDLMRLHLLRHGALMVASEEALEMSHRDMPVGLDFSAVDSALAEAKALDAEIRAGLAAGATAPEVPPAGRAEPRTPEMIEMRRLMDPGSWFL